jgi:thiol-disulfide isomerase/thioredoxin
MMSSRILFFGCAVVFLASVFGVQYYLKTISSGPTQVSSNANDISQYKKLKILKTKAGFVDIRELKGRPIMINFWASWCAPCMTEMPSIYKLHDKFKEKGFEVVAINLDVDLAKGMQALTSRFGQPKFLIVPGHEQEYVDIFEIEGVPFTLLVDRTGKIRYAKTGERDWMDAESLKLVEGLM